MAPAWNAAELYDIRTSEYGADIPIILELAAEAGPAVLELGCGTGRVLCALSEAGFDPVGIDASAEALEVAKRKLPAARLENQLMQSFELNSAFDLILVPFNSFEHLLTLADKLAALERISRHSRSSTLLYLDVTPFGSAEDDFTAESPARRIKTVTSETLPIDVWFQAERDLTLRRSYCTMTYRWIEPGGAGKEVTSSYVMQPVTADELWLMLSLKRFGIVGWYGDYQRTPYDPRIHKRLVVIARPNSTPGRS